MINSRRSKKLQPLLTISGIVALLVGVIYFFSPRPSAPQELAVNRTGALCSLVQSRGLALPETSPPAYDLNILSEKLGKEIGEASDRISSRIQSCGTVDELLGMLLQLWEEVDPDWALIRGTASGSRPSSPSARKNKTMTYVDATALRKLRDMIRTNERTLESRLLERCLESTVVWHTIFGSDVRDPAEALRPIDNTWYMLEDDGRPAPEKINLLVERLQQIPSIIQSVRECLQDPPRLWLELALDDLEGSRQFLLDLSHATGNIKNDSADSLQAAIERVKAALLDYKSYLAGSLESAKAGAPRDPRWVAYAIQSLEFFERSPRFAVEMLLEELRDSNAADRPSESQKDPMAIPSTIAKRIPEDCAEELTWARKFASEHFAAIPSGDPVLIISTPSQFRAAFPEAAYFSYSLGSSLRGRVMITPSDGCKVVISRDELRLTMIHEAYPGHHLQALYSHREASPIRLLYPSSWLSEGWACYVERLAVDLMPMTGRARREWNHRRTWMVWTCILEICVSAGALSETEAIDFLREVKGVPEKQARLMVGAMTRDPMASLGYVLGELEIRNARREAESRLGKRFDVRRFHEQVMSYGRVPPSLVRKDLEKTWK